MRFDIITIFPEAFRAYFDTSILARAQKEKAIDIHLHNLRTWATDRHKTVDDKPYGGGAGMVLMAPPILKAVDAIRKSARVKKTKIIVLSAKGKQFSQKTAYEWVKRYDKVIFVSGRYEGIDERVVKALRAEEISIGPYVLTDGDAAIMVIVSVISRLIPGVIKRESLEEESYGKILKQGAWGERRVEYPHYTRPEVVEYKGKKYRVPVVLLSGDHRKIKEWREKHVKVKST